MKNNKTVVLTGPECSGKTVLARELATIAHAPWVPERSVEYLEHLVDDYTLKDLENIALIQKKEIDTLATQNSLIFADTACLVMKVWAEVRFKEVPPIIERWWESSHNYTYLLCTPDLLWEPGPFRENPDDRHELFDLYLRHLREADRKFTIINGRSRLPKALEFLELSGIT